jgi:hypothetical protein
MAAKGSAGDLAAGTYLRRSEACLMQIKAGFAATGHCCSITGGGRDMPTDTIVVLAFVIAAFVFFAGALLYGDVTTHRKE